MTRELVTVQEAAERLRVHVETVRRWVREGKLPAKKIGATRKYLIASKDIDEELNKSSTPKTE